MSHRPLGAFLLLAVLVVLAGASTGGAAIASTPAPPDTVVVDNELVPDRDLDDCVSALPQPDCGSEARSGWRQWVIFGLLVVALSFIAWRIRRGARRNRPPAKVPDDTR